MARVCATGALLVICCLAGGCARVDTDLKAVLREYLAVQDSLRDAYGRYGTTGDIVGRSLRLDEGLTLRVLWHDADGHGAVSQSRALPRRMCLIFVGSPPGWLGYEQERVPLCDSPRRIDRLIMRQVPKDMIVDDPIENFRPHLPVIAALGVLGLVLVLGLPHVAPWGYRIVFWTPAALSVALAYFIVLRVQNMGVVSGGLGLLPLLLFIPPLLLNLRWLAVPAAIKRAGSRPNAFITILLVLGSLVWGGVSIWAAESDADRSVFAVLATFLLIDAVALVLISRAPRPPRRDSTSGTGP